MNVVILDTGCANLSSVKYAVQRLGYEPTVSREPEIVLQADKLHFYRASARRRQRWNSSNSVSLLT